MSFTQGSATQTINLYGSVGIGTAPSAYTQQKQKLYESDWTCSVTDYEVPNKPDWITYRQALRDVTTQTDPFAIVWPVAPV